MDQSSLERLEHKPSLVTCPSCYFTDQSAYFKYGTDNKGEQAAMMLLFCCIPCSIWSAVRPYMGVHYCSNCGLRLASMGYQSKALLATPEIFEDAIQQQPTLQPPRHIDTTDTLPSYTAAIESDRPIRKPLSPLGPLSSIHPATYGQLTAERLKAMRPVRLLRIAWDPETWVPTAIYDNSGRTKLFTVTMPAFTHLKPYHAPWKTPKDGIRANFYEYQEHGKDDIPWTAVVPHLRLSGYAAGNPPAEDLEWEVASAQLNKQKWDVKIYRPSATPGNIPVIARTPDNVLDEVPNVKASLDHLSWRSPVSRGALYWRWPGATSATVYDNLRICFDVYERPVAAHLDRYPPGSGGRSSAQDKPIGFDLRPILAPKVKEKDGRCPDGEMSRFAVFADVGDELLAEILMGWIVLCAQSRRHDQIPSD